MKNIFLFPLLFLLTACNSYIWSKQVYRYYVIDNSKLSQAESIVQRIKIRVEKLEGVRVYGQEGGGWAASSASQLDLRWHPNPLEFDPEPDKHKPFLIIVYPMWGSPIEVEVILKIIEEEIKASENLIFHEEIYQSHIPV